MKPIDAHNPSAHCGHTEEVITGDGQILYRCFMDKGCRTFSDPCTRRDSESPLCPHRTKPARTIHIRPEPCPNQRPAAGEMYYCQWNSKHVFCSKEMWESPCQYNKPEPVRESKWFRFLNGVQVNTLGHFTSGEIETHFPEDYLSWYQIEGTEREKNR